MKSSRTATKANLFDELRLPLICAPMLRISGIDLVKAACDSGIIGSFPTPNARDEHELESWLQILEHAKQKAISENRYFAPYCPNLIMRRDPEQLDKAIQLLIKYKTQMIITSVGSPKAIMPEMKAAGIQVFADIASLRHAEKALEAGVDGLILLSAGAGGKTGWANPFAFVRAVRSFYDGPVILAGGLSDGASLYASKALGCTLGYMGTRFIATQESMAQQAYKEMLISSTMDDVIRTNAITGMATSWLKDSLIQSGVDVKNLRENVTPEEAQKQFGYRPGMTRPARWKDIWSAGHSVSGVHTIPTVSELVEQLEKEYITASQTHH
ncbi:NAD(P)H-dependent flavin oxidoreductase [Orrella sp. 11846]|uniref:NAD(P)H-dependent flavin oxidoreductase n=1 Tax=Orrella sp. 11846 TaxID=3409913 RepID=UPI003B59FF58